MAIAKIYNAEFERFKRKIISSRLVQSFPKYGCNDWGEGIMAKHNKHHVVKEIKPHQPSQADEIKQALGRC